MAKTSEYGVTGGSLLSSGFPNTDLVPSFSFPSVCFCLPQLLVSCLEPLWSCFMFQSDEDLVPSELNSLSKKEFT